MDLRRPLRLRGQGPGCLLVRAKTDPEAFAAFYDRYAERVLVFFARRVLVAEVALDLTSETFAKALENRLQFRGVTDEEEQGRLFAIARSELSRYWTRGGVERAALERVGVPVPTLTDADIERIEDLADIQSVTADLHEAMASLPGDQAEAVMLRVVHEMTYEQIAASSAVSQPLVRARVSWGLKRLAVQLADGPAKDAA